MNRLMKFFGLSALFIATNLAVAQPVCPTDDLFQISPETPTLTDPIVLGLGVRNAEGVPISVEIDWEFVGQEANQIVYNAFIQGGGVGVPTIYTLDPLPAGTYQLSVSPYLVRVEEPDFACPPLSIQFTVTGAPSAAVPAPLFSLPGLLLLMGLFGLLGWAALRRH